MEVQFSQDELVERLFPIYFYRKYLDLGAKDLLGLELSPHHAMIIREWGTGKPYNDWVGSRGTGKTVLLAIFYVLQALLYANNKLVVIGGGGMRQGKFVMLECEKIINCQLSGQEEVWFAKSSLKNPHKVIYKDPAFWYIPWKNGSQIVSVPIGQTGEKIRGLRGYKNGKDEGFLISDTVSQAILEPMSYVLPDPTARKESTISIQDINTSTIDYTLRPFYKNFKEKLNRLMVGDKESSAFEINFEDCFWDKPDGEREIYWGMNFEKILKSRDDPTKDHFIWLAENKNIPMDISDTYYPFEELQIACSHLVDNETDLFLQPLYGCDGACVLGVDNAPVTANTAFVVLKVGEHTLEQRGSNTCLKTIYDNEEGCPYFDKTAKVCRLCGVNNVVYAYEENKMPPKERVKLIYDLMERFNIIHIAMDARGGGWEIAELLRDKENISNVIDDDAKPIFDPEDLRNVGIDGLPILTLFNTDAEMNTMFNSYMKSSISKQKLLFPKPVLFYIDKYMRETNDHIKTLVSQISRIKVKLIGKWFSFDVDSMGVEDTTKKRKKDLYSALLYAMGKIYQLEEKIEDKMNYDIGSPVWVQR